jgi:hypothetical protein
MLSLSWPDGARVVADDLYNQFGYCCAVESGIPRLGDFCLTRNRLILLYLEVPIERE